MLGDSVVFGVEQTQARTISSLLQGELDPDGAHLRVFNFGLGGLNLAELVEWLRLKDAIYDVDEIVMLLNPNDYARRDTIFEGADNGLYRTYRKPLWMGRFMVRKAIYRLMKGGKDGSVGWLRWLFAGNVVLMPLGFAYQDGGYALADQQGRVAAFLAAEGVRVTLPTAAFADDPTLYLDETDHLTDAGNVRMAQVMAEFLRGADVTRAR